MKQKDLKIGPFNISNEKPFAVIAGPCVIENEALTFSVAKTLKDITHRLKIPFIFKCSYDKANRSSSSSYRGPGIREGIRILARVKKELNVPILTDVHSVAELPLVSPVVDVLQIPAFLCRQTDLLLSAAKTRCAVNIKKGQFLAPWDTINIVKKIQSVSKKPPLLTERGVSFGYNNLIVDMRSLEVMKETGSPVVFDTTHSVQLPGGQGTSSGGQRQFIYPLARAAVSIGISTLFMEVHPKPEVALSDGPNAVRLKHVPELLKRLKRIDDAVKKKNFTKNIFL